MKIILERSMIPEQELEVSIEHICVAFVAAPWLHLEAHRILKTLLLESQDAALIYLIQTITKVVSSKMKEERQLEKVLAF